MKKLLNVFILAATIFSLSSCGYNGMVKNREAIDGAWGKVESAYQRRADLVPNLVSTVKGAADFEKSTLTAVIEARSKATSIQLKADDLTEENLQRFQEAQDGLSKALKSLLMVTENYPDLRATEAFRDLQAQLEGTENRINTERNNFNEAVQAYNTQIASFPEVMYAKSFGFTPRAYFKATSGSEKAPEVKF